MVVSLTDTNDRADLQDWAREFGSTHAVAGDYEREVWSNYALSSGRPQYIVIDREQVVVLASRDAEAAEALVESLL